MKTLHLIHTTKALVDLDTFIMKWEEAWKDPTRINNRTAVRLLNDYEDAENEVRKAFFEDTKDRNCLENCMLVGIDWLRKLAVQHP